MKDDRNGLTGLALSFKRWKKTVSCIHVDISRNHTVIAIFYDVWMPNSKFNCRPAYFFQEREIYFSRESRAHDIYLRYISYIIYVTWKKNHRPQVKEYSFSKPRFFTLSKSLLFNHTNDISTKQNFPPTMWTLSRRIFVNGKYFVYIVIKHVPMCVWLA